MVTENSQPTIMPVLADNVDEDLLGLEFHVSPPRVIAAQMETRRAGVQAKGKHDGPPATISPLESVKRSLQSIHFHWHRMASSAEAITRSDHHYWHRLCCRSMARRPSRAVFQSLSAYFSAVRSSLLQHGDNLVAVDHSALGSAHDGGLAFVILGIQVCTGID